MQFDKLILGTWAIGGWMWGGTDKNESIRAIQASIEEGINSIDTAPVYGFGVSEEIVGKAIKPYKNKIKIFSKCGLVWHKQTNNHYFNSLTNDNKPISVYKHAGKQSIIYECEQSLKRLGVDAIDLYQIHWPDTTTTISESMEAMNILLEQGKIKYAGVSNFNKELSEKSLNHCKIVSNQLPYSIINRGIEADVLPFCIKNNISVLAYSPLQRGLLTGKINKEYSFKKGDHRKNEKFFDSSTVDKVNKFLQAIKFIADSKESTISQIILAYTLRTKGISSLIIGARNEKQAIENSRCIEISLTEEEEKIITKELDRI